MMGRRLSFSLVVAGVTLIHAVAAFVMDPSKARLQRSHQYVVVNRGSSQDEDVSSTSSLGTSTTTSKEDFLHSWVAQKTRPDFKVLSTTIGDSKKPLVYLDSAATSHKPQAVLDTLSVYYESQNSNVHRGAHTLSRIATTAYENARNSVQQFIGASSRNEIVFTSGATESINLVVQSYGRKFLNKGDRVILTVAEHHSNLVPWQMLAEEKELDLQFVGMDQKGGIDVEKLYSLVTRDTKFVAFQHVSNVLGCINPVQEIVQYARQHAHADCKLLLDACQSVPHMPVNVQELGVDFLAASGHKMCAPTGIGFLWGREAFLNAMPPWKGGGEMIDKVTLQGSTWQPTPARFEAGTPAIAQAIGLGAAIEYLNKIGMDNINEYEHEIGAYLYEQLSQVPGITVLGPDTNRVALCSFHHDTVHPSDLSSFLDMEGVAVRAGHHCCQPLHDEVGISHSARASLYFYNTKQDVDDFIRALKDTLNFFGSLENGNNDHDDDEFVPFI